MLRSAKSDAPCVLIRCDVFCNSGSVASTQFRDLQRNRAAGCAGRRLRHAHITQHSNIYHKKLPEYVLPLELVGQIDALRSGNILLLSKGAHVILWVQTIEHHVRFKYVPSHDFFSRKDGVRLNVLLPQNKVL